MILSRESRKTLYWILGIAAALIVWDVVLLKDEIPNTTISAVLRLLSAIMVIPFGCGVLAGHFFWHKRGPRDEYYLTEQLLTLAIIGVILIVWGRLSDDVVRLYLSDRPHIVFVCLGFPAGHYLWPQYSDELGA